MGKLYIIATPIGNLEDITLRALRIFKEVDLILCEDTRETRKLLARYEIKMPTLSYHQHSKLQKIEQIIELLRNGKNLALVSDAGTPGISDPGGKLVDEVLRTFGEEAEIIPIPGPTALAAAASVSGFPTDKFLFLGFPPHKKGRNKFFKKIADSEVTAIFYESTYRILKSLDELKSAVGEREIVVCRELTKMFEHFYRGKIDEVIKKLKDDDTRGEFVVVVRKNNN
ncbi:16S rRNA (cytidine(1402)-2'-O)-methyltransferase [Candidatus Falkowbacteria bacterium]|nr:16S rRNA (cytidine(1402)-2'-O)-methyltransferase [Candidatus Falkowbacteria bacterium]